MHIDGKCKTVHNYKDLPVVWLTTLSVELNKVVPLFAYAQIVDELKNCAFANKKLFYFYSEV